MNYALVWERSFKKESYWKDCLWFNVWFSLFHVQIQEPKLGQLPQEHLSFLQNLLNLIITKYLKQEVDDDLSICVGGLSITGDIKIYPCHVIQW